MSARHVIQTAVVFDNSQPQYLLIEYGDEGIGRMVGQYFKLEDAILGAHQRVGNKFSGLRLVEKSGKREEPTPADA